MGCSAEPFKCESVESVDAVPAVNAVAHTRASGCSEWRMPVGQSVGAACVWPDGAAGPMLWTMLATCCCDAVLWRRMRTRPSFCNGAGALQAGPSLMSETSREITRDQRGETSGENTRLQLVNH
jgi:hypothetical protein